MFRFWFLRGIWRNTSKIARATAGATDKAMPGKGWVNGVAVVWFFFAWMLLLYVLHPGNLPGIFGCMVVAVGVGWYVNKTLPKGLQQWQDAGKAASKYKYKKR